MMIEAVVFDIGNVLITWNPERHYDAPDRGGAAQGDVCRRGPTRH